MSIKVVPHTVERIVVLGDIHGDIIAAIRLLQLSKVIPKDTIYEQIIDNKIDLSKYTHHLPWIGKKTHVVQIGDQLDNCRPLNNKEDCNKMPTKLGDDIQVLYLFYRLHQSAVKYGGAVYSLLGNHELLNLDGDFRYVSFPVNSDDNIIDLIIKRKRSFNTGEARFLLSNMYSIVIIGSNLFVHAGIVPGDLDNIQHLKELNNKMTKWLLTGKNKKYQLDANIKALFESIFWNRLYGAIPKDLYGDEEKSCHYLEEVLDFLKVKRMIIGHTPQMILGHGINSTCNEKLWKVDIGVSRAFDKFDKYNLYKSDVRYIQVLEIIKDKILRVLK